ncbi:UDP-N-acetylenolpyruvoylglucosamine reductase, partial [Pseudomonas syringae pv. tagetis]
MTLQVQSAYSLNPSFKFGGDVQARLFAESHSDDAVREALANTAEHDVPLQAIGGGSNLLPSGDVQSLV